MTDLKPFCLRNTFSRPELHQPFSVAGYTYATNAHIIVRVPRRENVPERSDPPTPYRLFTNTSHVSWRALGRIDIPDAIKKIQCEKCDGRGTVHNCPGCTCTCTECNGSGRLICDASISIGGGLFDIKYALLLASLPGIMVPETIGPSVSPPMPFRFDDGDGLLCGLIRKLDNHIETIA